MMSRVTSSPVTSRHGDLPAPRILRMDVRAGGPDHAVINIPVMSPYPRPGNVRSDAERYVIKRGIGFVVGEK